MSIEHCSDMHHVDVYLKLLEAQKDIHWIQQMVRLRRKRQVRDQHAVCWCCYGCCNHEMLGSRTRLLSATRGYVEVT